MRSSGLKKSGFLTGALCLVAVCASAQNDSPFTGLSLPLTFGQKFILTNKLLFASSENQLQDVKIVYAYKPQGFSAILKNNELPVKSSFKITKTHADASEDSKRTWDVWQIDLPRDDNQNALKSLQEIVKEIEKKKGFIGISKDDHERFVTDKEASGFTKDAKQFFIFKSGRQTQDSSPSAQNDNKG